MGFWDFSLTLQTKPKIKLTLQREMIFQLLQLERLEIILFSEKNIYKTNKNQKVLMPLMAKYTKLLKKIVELVDPKNVTLNVLILT